MMKYQQNWQKTIHFISTPLTHIINLSLATGIVPEQMKLAKVKSIHKSSDPNILNNYRPISLLPAFSKLLEKIMFNKVMNYLNSNDILYKHQYGYHAKTALYMQFYTSLTTVLIL